MVDREYPNDENIATHIGNICDDDIDKGECACDDEIGTHNQYICDNENKNVRLDVFLTAVTSYSRSRIKTLIEDGMITVNGKITKSGYSMHAGDAISLTVPNTAQCNADPEDIPLDIVYEDDDIAVINKSQGMVTHPSNTSPSGTLVNALMFRMKNLSSINGVIRPGIVHRLDKNTSGLIVVAKNDKAHISLSEQIAKKEARRIYVALVDGNIKEDNGLIDEPIGRNKRDRKLMAVVDDGRSATTLYKVLARYGQYTLVEYELKTGRTHQIRVHSKYKGHAVVGDTAYGGSNMYHLAGQLLHAKTLILTHPTSGEVLTFSAPLPDYFEAVLAKLESKKR